MKRLVAPVRWADQHRVEHPPLMMKALVQGVCGGLRWLETKTLAQYLARRALQERQMVGSRAEYAAFALRSPRRRLQHNGKKVTGQRHTAAENSVADLAHAVPRLSLPPQRTNTPTAARTCNASNALLPAVPQRDNAIVTNVAPEMCEYVIERLAAPVPLLVSSGHHLCHYNTHYFYHSVNQ